MQVIASIQNINMYCLHSYACVICAYYNLNDYLFHNNATQLTCCVIQSFVYIVPKRKKKRPKLIVTSLLNPLGGALHLQKVPLN